MNEAIGTLLISAGVLLILDSIYLLLNKQFFESQIIRVQHVAPKIKYGSAIICYILLILGLYFFIIQKHRPAKEAFILGALIYGIFETTNYAILKNWKLQTVIIDTLWGGILLFTTTLATYNMQKLLRN